MILTLRKARAALEALNILDLGFDVIVREGGFDKAVKIPYKGWSVATRVAITKNMMSLRPAVQSYQEAISARQRAMADSAGNILVTDQFELEKEAKELLDTEEDFNLIVLTERELKLSDNPIPPSTLASLASAEILTFEER
jgi:hypothetical protein